MLNIAMTVIPFGGLRSSGFMDIDASAPELQKQYVTKLLVRWLAECRLGPVSGVSASRSALALTQHTAAVMCRSGAQTKLNISSYGQYGE